MDECNKSYYKNKQAQQKVETLIKTLTDENLKLQQETPEKIKLNENALQGLHKQLNTLKEQEKAYDQSLVKIANTPTKETVFKVGDYVSSEFFDGVEQITEITGDKITVTNHTDIYFYAYELTLICGFTKGEEVYIDDSDAECSDKIKRIFIQYRPELKSPFECTLLGCEEEFRKGEPYDVRTYKYAKPIEEKKYEPYSEPKISWRGKKVVTKNNYFEGKITGFYVDKNNEWVLQFDGLLERPLKDCWNDIKWADGSTFGKELSDE